MIEHFSKSEFEQALPKGFWQYAGLDKGEHTYNIPINQDILIHVRSSVDSSGFSAETGEDSIRAWLIGSDGKPLGAKVHKWINRVAGWDQRLLDMLRTLWQRAKSAGYCPECHKPKSCFKCKEGKNKGKLFAKCTTCSKQYFTWLEE